LLRSKGRDAEAAVACGAAPEVAAPACAVAPGAVARGWATAAALGAARECAAVDRHSAAVPVRGGAQACAARAPIGTGRARVGPIGVALIAIIAIATAVVVSTSARPTTTAFMDRRITMTTSIMTPRTTMTM